MQERRNDHLVLPDTPVVTFEPASPALLVPNAHVIVFATQAADGKMTATCIVAGKNGLVRPICD